MANEEHLAKLREGVEAWNAWREANPEVRPDLGISNLKLLNLGVIDPRGKPDAYLAGVRNFNDTVVLPKDLRGINLRGASLIMADLSEADLSEANLSEAILFRANLSNANLTKANLRGADLQFGQFAGATAMEAKLDNADLRSANFRRADLRGASSSRADLDGADLGNADFRRASLWGSTFYTASFRGADLREAHMEEVALIDADLSGTMLDGCNIYGASVWDVTVNDQTSQRDLRITPSGRDKVTVDDLKVAQFIYLLLRNPEIRHVIDTITSKVVLILGRFTDDRKQVLDALRDELRKRNYTPVLFDFDKPNSRDLTETVSTLAHMARFVIADITDAKSIPQELMKIVPNLPSLPVRPIILDDQYDEVYAMFKDLGGYLSVMPPWRYQDSDHLLASLETEVLGPALSKAEEIEERRKAFEQELLNK